MDNVTEMKAEHNLTILKITNLGDPRKQRILGIRT